MLKCANTGAVITLFANDEQMIGLLLVAVLLDYGAIKVL